MSRKEDSFGFSPSNRLCPGFHWMQVGQVPKKNTFMCISQAANNFLPTTPFSTLAFRQTTGNSFPASAAMHWKQGLETPHALWTCDGGMSTVISLVEICSPFLKKWQSLFLLLHSNFKAKSICRLDAFVPSAKAPAEAGMEDHANSPLILRGVRDPSPESQNWMCPVLYTFSFAHVWIQPDPLREAWAAFRFWGPSLLDLLSHTTRSLKWGR